MITANVMSEDQVDRIFDTACRILEEVGVVVENTRLVEVLSGHGAEAASDGRRVKFSRRVVEDLIAGSSREYDQAEGVENSCTLPYGDRAAYSNGVECTAGTYPTAYLDLDGSVRQHTLETVADMTRLADYLGNIDRLGAMGVPSDVPGELTPLYQRLIAWKYAEKKRSGCGEVRSPDLIPYIVEMGEIMADFKKVSPRTYTFGEVELISPLRFAAEEAAIFVGLWEKGYLCGVGFMHSAGGTAPATIAGTLALNLAENIFINFLYRYCYGFRKLWFQTNASVMDMKSGMFPFGRPERGLMALAVGQIARRFDAGLWASAIYPDAKVPSCEAGMQSAFNCVPAILAGTLGLECFGLLSGAEMNSPIQLVIDNEFCGALKRFARGFDVDEQTLAFDVIREAGPGGMFTATEHTVRHFRTEHWQPEIFSREPLNAWLASGRRTDVDIAREMCEEILRDYHPRNMTEEVERELLAVIDSARKHLVESSIQKRR